MGFSRIQGVKIDAVASAVPAQVVEVASYAEAFGSGVVKKISLSTGVTAFRKVPADICSSDLCYAAAQSVLASQQVAPEDIGALIFVSQTPDYILPATSCILQGRLGLPKACATFDINLGCSGYVYGLWVAAGLIASGMVSKVLLLVGDTISKTLSEQDRSVAMLFGDAGSATLLSASEEGQGWFFNVGTDGTGWENIIIRAGGSRHKTTAESLERTEVDGGLRSPAELEMKGSAVFEFTQSEVPQSIEALFSYANVAPEQIDYFVPHQANRFMLSHMASKLGFPREKLVVGLEEFGNTSCASIPLAMVTKLADVTEKNQVLLSGFGVGLSWASAILDLKDTKILPLVEV